MTNEEWRPVPNHPGYAVSSLGRVIGPRGTVLKAGRDTHGYLFVNASQSAKKKRARFWVHSVVAAVFGSARPPGYVADHINGVRHDNRAENLRWVTRSGNVRHGEAVVTAKLNEQVVKVLRHLLATRPRRGLLSLLTRLHGSCGACPEAIRKAAKGINWDQVR